MTATAQGLSNWRVEGIPFSLACGVDVLNRILHSMELRDRGLLWGRRQGTDVEVLDISLEAETQPGLERVGWYQFRFETNLHLTSDDLLFHEENFSEPGGLALILRPTTDSSFRVGVFFREVDGSIRAASSYQEVVISSAGQTIVVPLPAFAQGRVARPTAMQRREEVVERTASGEVAPAKSRGAGWHSWQVYSPG